MYHITGIDLIFGIHTFDASLLFGVLISVVSSSILVDGADQLMQADRTTFKMVRIWWGKNMGSGDGSSTGFDSCGNEPDWTQL